MGNGVVPLPRVSEGAILTVGTFDGVHRGHRDILDRLVRRGRAMKKPSVVVTFQGHPLDVLNPSAAPLLLTVGAEKLDELADFGLDYVIVLPFTSELASYTPEEFVSELLLRRFHMSELLIGYDHGLGKDRSGSVDHLTALGRVHNFPVEVVPPLVGSDGVPISSTSIRRAVAYGDLRGAAGALGTSYWFRGRVVPGDQRGRELGFPTLNLALPSTRKLLPPEGVYAVTVRSRRGNFGGMMNLGQRPTFDDQRLTLEVHVFDMHDNWYGLDVRVEFTARLRETMRFSSPTALREQLARDADAARRALTEV